jgi:uncharacterized protein YceH (UPF0502 family)
VEPDAVEIRVLGCLIEKQRTTPDAYPLSLNALRLACNQATNRDPVVDFDEPTIRAALDRLGARGWTRLASWSSSRAMKYRHLAGEALALSGGEQALMCVLMLRGAQTPGELKQRCERMHRFEDAELEATLASLAERDLVARLERRAGQREARFVQLLDAGAEWAGAADDAVAQRATPIAAPAATDERPGDGERLASIERQLERLRDEVRALRARLGESS